jgi:hypothetical protein
VLMIVLMILILFIVVMMMLFCLNLIQRTHYKYRSEHTL